MYLYAKALHMVFVVTWFAALFYMVRLYVYWVEAQSRTEPQVRQALSEQLMRMAVRLFYIIAWPSVVLVIGFGGWMLYLNPGLLQASWMWAKLVAVALLLAYHMHCQYLLNRLRAGKQIWSSMRLRLWNEVPTLLLFAIVFLAVFKRLSGLGAGVVALGGLAGVLWMAVWIYRFMDKR